VELNPEESCVSSDVLIYFKDKAKLVKNFPMDNISIFLREIGRGLICWEAFIDEQKYKEIEGAYINLKDLKEAIDSSEKTSEIFRYLANIENARFFPFPDIIYSDKPIVRPVVYKKGTISTTYIGAYCTAVFI